MAVKEYGKEKYDKGKMQYERPGTRGRDKEGKRKCEIKEAKGKE